MMFALQDVRTVRTVYMLILVANSMPEIHVYILVYTVPSLEVRIAMMLSIFPVTNNMIYSIWARMCLFVFEA